jgi:MFS family permease
VWRLTGSAQLLGVVQFLGQLPLFLFGIYAGSIADRLPRRGIVLTTQTIAIVQATVLAGVTLSGVVRPWHVAALAAVLGLANAFEVPARQALLGDIAGADMPNAVALNSAVFNAARVVGPALAGSLVAAVGEGWCFAANAISFAGTYRALLLMDVPPTPRHVGSRGAHLLEGIAYAGRNTHVLALLALLVTSSLCGVPYLTLLPAVTAQVLHGGASLYGSLLAAAGAGALVGAIALMARRGLRGLGRRVALGATAFGVGVVIIGASRAPALSAAGLVLAGFGMITQSAGTLTLLQGLAPPDLRGRVMGLFATLFQGMAPFGALAAGFAAQRIGAPRTLVAGGLAVVVASAAFHLALPRLRRTVLAQHPTIFPPAAS